MPSFRDVLTRRWRLRESTADKIARLERENAELRERVRRSKAIRDNWLEAHEAARAEWEQERERLLRERAAPAPEPLRRKVIEAAPGWHTSGVGNIREEDGTFLFGEDAALLPDAGVFVGRSSPQPTTLRITVEEFAVGEEVDRG